MDIQSIRYIFRKYPRRWGIFFSVYLLVAVLLFGATSLLQSLPVKLTFLQFLLAFSVLLLPPLFWLAGRFLIAPSDWKQTDSPHGTDIAWFILIAAIGFFLFNHSDLYVTAWHGKLMLDAAFQGQFSTFYQFAYDMSGNTVYAVYYYPIYLVFALWNLPAYLVFKSFAPAAWEKWVTFSQMPYPLLLWNKLLTTIVYLLIAYVLYQIGKRLKLSEKNAKWLAVLWLLSPFAIFSQFYFGQYDCFGILFMMLGFLSYLKKENWKFCIWISVAATFKLFALFLFIPLILYREKRVGRLILYGGTSILGILLCNLPLLYDMGFAAGKEFESGMVERLFAAGVPGALGNLSLFVAAYLAILLFAYAASPREGLADGLMAVWLGTAVFVSLFLFVSWHPQWIIYLTPFVTLALMLAQNRKNILLLDCGLTACFFLLMGSVSIHSIGNVALRPAIPHIFQFYLYDITWLKPIYTLDGKLPVSLYFTAFAVLLVTIFICLSLSVFPKHPAAHSKEWKPSGEPLLSRDLIWLRTGLLWLLYAAPVFVTYLLYLYQILRLPE